MSIISAGRPDAPRRSSGVDDSTPLWVSGIKPLQHGAISRCSEYSLSFSFPSHLLTTTMRFFIAIQAPAALLLAIQTLAPSVYASAIAPRQSPAPCKYDTCPLASQIGTLVNTDYPSGSLRCEYYSSAIGWWLCVYDQSTVRCALLTQNLHISDHVH